MRRYFRFVASLGLSAIASTSLGCRPGPASSPPLHPESVWSPFLHGTKATAVDPTRYRGPLFALRTEDASPRSVPLDGAVWIRCALEVPYRFESLAPKTKVVDIADLASLARFFPVTYPELRPFIESGQPLRVVYEVTGRFVVDVPSPRAASIVCPAATHHVKAIAVGAYRVMVGVDGSNESGAVELADVRTDTHGRPAMCKTAKSVTPLAGCTVPLAYELVPIPGHDPNRKMRLDESAGPEHLPRAETMPGATQLSDGPSVTAGFEDCYAGFKTTGDAKQDLATLTARCGEPTGMVPHSEVLSGWQAATAEVARYTVTFEAGQCYRAFGVGGEGVRDLDMGWHDPRGRLIARDVRPDGWAVVSPNGPTCVNESGEYELVVSVEGGQGAFAVQVWRVER